MTCALPLGCKFGNPRWFRSMAIGGIVLEEAVNLHPDQFLVQTE